MGDPTSLQEQLFHNFQKMHVSNTDVNILLLGETGVGKSTFINSFANYLEYNSFDIAERNKVRCLIPAKFTVTNENFEEKVVHIGSDDNENATMSASATQETRSYVFPFKREGINRIRLIDTPGIGDTKGIDKDNENMENILAYISNLEELHAICFLLKPNNTRLTVMFQYCIKQLLSRLEKSASQNVIFLFTNTRSSFYKPGDTTTALKSILKDISSKPPNVNIEFGKDNVFCLDNESFRYLVATKQGIKLGNKDSFSQSWSHSVDECWRMINTITGRGDSIIKMVPHKVKNTLSVNEARRVILQLSKPLADIAELINDNINTLDKHNKALRTDNQSIAQLKENLYVPVVNLRFKELTQPTTVCTAAKCSEIYTVRDIKKYHYKQRCHDPCYLQNVPKEIIGSPELVNCWAMTNSKCKICTCDFSVHMHIYYISETFDDKIDNEGVKAQIKDRETALEQTKKLIRKIEARKADYEQEKESIIKAMAKFAHFLQRNAISPYNDAYQGYIQYLIDREKSNGPDCDFEVVRYHEELLRRYGEEKRILDTVLSTSSGVHSAVTAQEVFDSVKALYNLQHTGTQIRELYDKHTSSQSKEHKNTEVVLDAFQGNRPAQINKNNNKKKGKKQQQQQQNQNNPRNRNSRGQNQPRSANASGYGRGNYQNQFNPQGYPPPLMNQQQQGFPGPHHGYPHQGPSRGNYQNPNYFGGPPVFQNYPPHYQPNNYQQFSPQSYYPNDQHPPQSGYQNRQQQQFNQNAGDRSGMSRSGQDREYEEWLKNSFTGNSNENDPSQYNPSNTSVSAATNDPRFDEWLASTMSNSSSNLPKRHYNNLSARKESSSEEEDSDESNAKEDEDNEDEDFNEFMRQNGLEYLVKSSGKSFNINDNTNKKTRQDDSDMYGGASYGLKLNEDGNNFKEFNKGHRYESNNDNTKRGNKKGGILQNIIDKFNLQ